MAFTDAIVTTVGEPTKSSTANSLAANTEFNREKADVQHNFDISTGTGYHKDIIAITAGATTKIQIDNTAADGDPIMAFALSGVDKFTMGVDDGDSDQFKIGTTAIGTGTMFTLNSTGRLTLIGTWENPLLLGAKRLWYDATNTVLRVKGTDPTSETDGNMLVEG